MDQYAVSDVWRFFNPSAKQFSFFLPVHQTFSRIDYFHCDNKLLPLIRDCTYNPIVILDHAAVIVDLSLPGGATSRSFWHLNSIT